MSLSRNHSPASSWVNIYSLSFILVEILSLITNSGPTSTSNGRKNISTLAMYNFPCKFSVDNYEMALLTCPERLLVPLTMFTTNSVSYVQSNTSSHYSSWKQNQPLHSQGTWRHVPILWQPIEWYSPKSWQSGWPDKWDCRRFPISLSDLCVPALSALSSFAMIMACKCIYWVVLSRMSRAWLSASAPQQTVIVKHSGNPEQPRVRLCRAKNQAQNIIQLWKHLLSLTKMS